MNILCISWFDNGGQMQAVTDALNKYTEYDCRHLNFVKTYLNYKTDINFTDCTEDYIQYILDNSDFFIFSELIPNALLKYGILNKLNRNNTILRCYGSPSRKQLSNLRQWWLKHFGAFTSGGLDPTIHPYLGFTAYHIPNIYEFDTFPEINKTNNIKICHASTNFNMKNTDIVSNILNKLQNNYNVEPLIISETSWDDTLKLKAGCNITIDQFKLGAYAGSAIESMYLKHVVISRISPLVRSYHPDLPILQATTDNLYSILESIINNTKLINSIGETGHSFAINEHSAKKNIIKWKYLIEWVLTGFS